MQIHVEVSIDLCYSTYLETFSFTDRYFIINGKLKIEEGFIIITVYQGIHFRKLRPEICKLLDDSENCNQEGTYPANKYVLATWFV